jgi:hypothetical protein
LPLIPDGPRRAVQAHSIHVILSPVFIHSIHAKGGAAIEIVIEIFRGRTLVQRHGRGVRRRVRRGHGCDAASWGGMHVRGILDVLRESGMNAGGTGLRGRETTES